MFTLQYGRHPYMQNCGYAIDNPYDAVTDFTGSFSPHRWSTFRMISGGISTGTG